MQKRMDMLGNWCNGKANIYLLLLNVCCFSLYKTIFNVIYTNKKPCQLKLLVNYVMGIIKKHLFEI